MNYKKQTLFIVLSVAVFSALIATTASAASSCCPAQTSKATMVPISAKAAEVVELSPRVTEEAISSYLSIQKALASDSMEQVTANAAKLHAVTQLKEAEQLASARDINTARLHFERVSEHLIAAVRKNGAKHKDLRLVHCPMAFNNRGAFWLQEGEPIANPYFGSRMLRCGEFRDL
jgi:membrane fusion protein, copper/silver efflux system